MGRSGNCCQRCERARSHGAPSAEVATRNNPARTAGFGARLPYDDWLRTSQPLDGVPIPVDTQPRIFRRVSASIADRKLSAGDGVELRNVLDPAAVGHRAAKSDVQLHQEVRTDRNVERFGHVSALTPRRNAYDARHYELHDRASVCLEIILELRNTVERFADRNRHAGLSRQLAMRT